MFNMSISSISNYVPEIRFASPKQITENITKIAVPLIILAAVSMPQQAEAITYVECFNNCDKHRDVDALSKFVCYALCAIFSKG